MRVIDNMVQGTPDWIEFRKKHFTASEASIMMNASKYMTRSELLHAKYTGEFPEPTKAQEYIFAKGHEIEAKARPLAEDTLNDELYPCTAESDEYPHLAASFDGITMLEDVVWECKQWNESKAERVRKGEVPQEDYWQVMQQLLVSGAEYAVYMVGYPLFESSEWIHWPLLTQWLFISGVSGEWVSSKEFCVFRSLPASMCIRLAHLSEAHPAALNGAWCLRPE